MARRAAERAKDLLAVARTAASTPAPDRRQQAHEAGEVVDPAPARLWIDDVFGIGNAIARLHPIGGDAERQLVREEIVRNAHLVAVRVGTEGEQGGVLPFPPEPSDARLAGREIDDARRPAADAVAIAVGRILERQELIVADRLDEAGAKEWNRNPPREDRRIIGQARLAAVAGHREQLEQRLP